MNTEHWKETENVSLEILKFAFGISQFLHNFLRLRRMFTPLAHNEHTQNRDSIYQKCMDVAKPACTSD